MPQVVAPPPDAPVYPPRVHKDMPTLLSYWDMFCVHPVDEHGRLATQFIVSDAVAPTGRVVFHAGTDRDVVGYWFEAANPEFHVGSMLRIYQFAHNVEARKRAWRALQPPWWKRAVITLYRAMRKGR